MNNFRITESSTNTPITEKLKELVKEYNKENQNPVKDIMIFEIDPYTDMDKLREDLSHALDITGNNKLVAVIVINLDGISEDLAQEHLKLIGYAYGCSDISEFVNPKSDHFKKTHTFIRNYKHAIPFKRFIMGLG